MKRKAPPYRAVFTATDDFQPLLHGARRVAVEAVLKDVKMYVGAPGKR